MAEMLATCHLNGGGSGDNNRKTKKERKSKIFKLFRSKKKYEQFDSKMKNATHSKTADYNQQDKNSTSNNWEKLSELEEHKKGQSPITREIKDMTKSCKKKHFKDQDNDCVNSGTQTATFVEITAEKVGGELVNIGQGHAVIDRDTIHIVSDEHIGKKGDSQVKGDHVLLKERSCYHKMTDMTEIVDPNKTGGLNTNDGTKKFNTAYGKNKWHRSKRFQKLKRKLHLSNYRELYESSETVDDIAQSDGAGYCDVRKKKRLKQFGNNVRKALVSGFRGMSPFANQPNNTNHNSTYYGTASLVWF
ncbi:uncharacterized protein LOC144348346 [Saccoglossus kowalevskii]